VTCLRVSVPEAIGGKTVVGQLTVDQVSTAGFVTAYGCADGLPTDGDGTDQPLRPQLRRTSGVGRLQQVDREGRRQTATCASSRRSPQRSSSTSTGCPMSAIASFSQRPHRHTGVGPSSSRGRRSASASRLPMPSATRRWSAS
jgi:hypothetical protein